MSDTIQEAARKFSLLVAPDIRRITLHGPHGKAVTIQIPRDGTGAAPILEPVTQPIAAVKGWDFSQPTPRFDGTVVPIHGRKLDLLKVLAASPVPLRISGLQPAWAPECDAEDGSIRWFIGDLRKALKAAFTDLKEPPIRSGPTGYWLTIR